MLTEVLESPRTDFLRLEDLSFSYGNGNIIVDRINYTVECGAIHCLLGRSGCGKTTLLKLAAGLLNPTAGAAYLESTEVLKPSRKTGFVFQSPTLLEWLSVEQNILLPLSLHQSIASADRERARELLELVGLDSHGGHFPEQLSGGQQSRVALARALITNPLVLFMDEPFAALDAITREELHDDFLQLCELQRTTVLFVTHDIGEAVYLADQVAIMSDGKIQKRVPIPLDKPRIAQMRYDSSFNALCAEARRAMDELR